MPARKIKSLFSSINFFRRQSQTWAATRGKDTDRLDDDGCRIEPLESRVLMSTVSLQAVEMPAMKHPAAHNVQPLSNKIKTSASAPAAPVNLAASPLSPTSVKLTWAAGDSQATGFLVLRGTDGIHFTTIAKITSANVTTYTDTTALSFHTYDYEVEETAGTLISAASTMTSVTTPLATPTTLVATATGPNIVQLAWPLNEPKAGGYYVLRATNGGQFSQIAQLTALKAGSYTDSSAASDTQYTYEVEAFNGSNTSAVSKTASATTPLRAPTALSASYQPGSVTLSWTNNDSSTAGYLIFRSSNGKTFTQIGSVSNPNTTTYADSTAQTGQSYTYKVQAVAGSVTSAASSVVVVNTPLTPPINLVAIPSGPSVVNLSWTDQDANATGYVIYRATSGVNFAQIGRVTGTNANTYVDKSAVSGKSYTYQVRAISGTITSTPATSSGVTLSLLAPATLTATATSPTSVKLVWAVSETLATGYNILRSSGGSSFTTIATLSGETTASYVDSVASATTYTYEVQAINSSNSSAVSKTTSVTTPLLAVSNLSASLSGSTVTLNWTDNDPAATGYNVLRSTDGVHFSQFAALTSGTAATYSDSSVQSGRAYTYRVQAVGSGGLTSSATSSNTVTDALAAPSGLATDALGASTVQLNWTDNDPNAAGYVVLRSANNVAFAQIATVTGGATAAYTDKAADSGQTYTYEIEAVNGTVTSPASATASATTPLATPASLKATATTTAVTLTWTNVEPLATGYNILRSTDGVHFTQLAQITSAKTLTYSDTNVSSATTYQYEVQAIGAGNQSAVSAPTAVTTPLGAPYGLTATFQNGDIVLGWTDNDSNAAGYYILRTSGKTTTEIANVTNPTATGYTDTTALSGHSYIYQVQAYSGSVLSALSAAASANVPLAAPSSLTVVADTSASVQLAWTDNDTNAAGYYVLRSTDGIHFTQIAALTSASADSYTDTKIATATSYTYEVQAYAGTITSAASNTVNPTTPLAVPTALTATPTGAYISLAWTDSDTAATSYNILRSTDGISFTPLGTSSTKSYVDATAAPGQTYYYQVQSTNGTLTSAVSSTASATTPSGNVTNGVSVTTRFGDELVITAAGADDIISVTESNGTLDITGDGQTFTDTAPAGGTFIYTRGGSDSISVGSSVNSPLTIDSIDNAPTVINSNSGTVNAWIDSTDTLLGSGTVHKVASFAGGVSKALGASLSNPKDAGTTAKDNLSLFGTGPVAADVNQGSVGDCYFLSSLAAFANQSPQTLLNSAVDLGDGTYAVEFYSNNNPVYVRVNNSFTVGGFNGYLYAHPGSNNTIWAAVFEKAFAYFRTGANTYASLNSGWMNEVYTDLGVDSTAINPGSFSDNALFNLLSNDLSNGDAVTFGTQSAPNLVQDHAYTLLRVQNVNGVNQYVVRNPWGTSGDGLENSQGIATLTYAQFVANFVSGTAATN